ncbi:MAG: PDZ domain-containing protein, partial [Xanthomonadales bacterium]|nr:PDZ domain-containing protein [Xanthomonadales bacterium]
GALINARGEVIGISTRNLGGPMGGQNIGFAIPIGLASDVMRQIIEYGSVRRGWLGAQFGEQPLSLQADGSVRRRGIQVGEVTDGGPAWLAGIRDGDVLLSLDGRAIDDARAFQLEIAQREPGTEVELEVARGDQSFQTYATLIQQPPLR